MAWTTPRTWTDGELVNAAIMNGHVRDNLNATGPHLIVRKTADESVSNSTYQADDSLILPVSANETWRVEWLFVYQANTTADLKFRFTFPSSATISYSYTWTLAGGTHADIAEHTSTSPGPDSTVSGDGTGLSVVFPVHMLYVGGSSAGNVGLDWAQDTTDAGATIMKANSTLWAVKLA